MAPRAQDIGRGEAAAQPKLIEKANANLIKAAKDDKLKLAKESLDKGASLDVVNEKGHAVSARRGSL